MNEIELLKKLVSFKSVTPSDGGGLGFVEEFMQGWQARWICGGQGKEATKNLFLRKQFNAEGKTPVKLCFAGHIDVVPVDKFWSKPPFEATLEDGFLYGRGTQDMKGGVAAFLATCKEASEFNGEISILLTSDEEGDGKFGTKFALEELAREGLLPEFVVVAEPTCDTRFGDTIKVGRRGSINGVLRSGGRSGHAAYPQKCRNPIHLCAEALSKICGAKLCEKDEFFEATTLVVTDVRAGMEVCNVTPSELKVMFNVRNAPRVSKEDVKALVEAAFSGVEFELQLTQPSLPFLTNPRSKVVQNLTQILTQKCGFAPSLNCAGGTSDARHFAALGVDVVEFGVVNDRIHACDERVEITQVTQLKEVFAELIKSF